MVSVVVGFLVFSVVVGVSVLSIFDMQVLWVFPQTDVLLLCDLTNVLVKINTIYKNHFLLLVLLQNHSFGFSPGIQVPWRGDVWSRCCRRRGVCAGGRFGFSDFKLSIEKIRTMILQIF